MRPIYGIKLNCAHFSRGRESIRGVDVWLHAVAYPKIFFGGVQQIQLRTEDRENGDMGAVAHESGVLEAAVVWYKKFNFI